MGIQGAVSRAVCASAGLTPHHLPLVRLADSRTSRIVQSVCESRGTPASVAPLSVGARSRPLRRGSEGLAPPVAPPFSLSGKPALPIEFAGKPVPPVELEGKPAPPVEFEGKPAPPVELEGKPAPPVEFEGFPGGLVGFSGVSCSSAVLLVSVTPF